MNRTTHATLLAGIILTPVLVVEGINRYGESITTKHQREARAFVERLPKQVQDLIAGKPYKDARGNVYFKTTDGHRVQCYDHPSSPNGSCTHPGFSTQSGPINKSGSIQRAVQTAFSTDHLGLTIEELGN